METDKLFYYNFSLLKLGEEEGRIKRRKGKDVLKERAEVRKEG